MKRRIVRTWPLLAVAALCVPLAARLRVGSLRSQESASPRDSTVEAATAALEAGRPWAASRLLAPLVRDEARRSPSVMLLAATAASEWGGWEEVMHLLGSARWVDSLFEGRGRVLLARAALAQQGARAGRDSAALVHARLAMTGARDSSSRSLRLVLLARALESAGRRDSARAAYARAAAQMPAVSDWLRLRAASLTADSAERAETYAMLRVDVARSRIPWTEAVARERSGNSEAAARAYAAVGARVEALRVRLSAARDDSSRRALRRELVSLIESRRGSGVARNAVELLDQSFSPLTAAEHLAIARSAAISGPAPRAAASFASAFERGLGTNRDRYSYGRILSGLRRDREAAAEFARVTGSSSLAALAAYQRARSLLRQGVRNEARTALRAVLRDYPADTTAASSALFLLADRATDDGRDDIARPMFLDLGRRYPTSALAPGALFRAAIIALVADSAQSAAEELDALLSRYGGDEEATAARYWAGRAWERAGNTARARARWQETIARDRRSYYALLSAERLGIQTHPMPAVAPLGTARLRHAAIDSAISRAELLEHLGLNAEARHEYDWLERNADASRLRLLATGVAFAERGNAARAIKLGRRALTDGAGSDTTVYGLIYPIAYEAALTAEAERHGLDPALIAALIRQESQFTPEATSAAGARGLMQLMPYVGQHVAAARHFPMWNAALLYQPDVNLELGAAHLAGLMREYERTEHALAAYNAGSSRVWNWLSKGGAGDPEVFVERIPFKETRDYVRIVMRNRAIYRALYPRLPS